MDSFSFIVGLVTGGLVMFVLMIRSRSWMKREIECACREVHEIEKLGDGLTQYTERLRKRKEESKAKIIAALQETGTMKNAAIAALLGVSSATVVRYMDELEKEGAVEQVGGRGRGVRYQINHP